MSTVELEAQHDELAQAGREFQRQRDVLAEETAHLERQLEAARQSLRSSADASASAVIRPATERRLARTALAGAMEANPLHEHDMPIRSPGRPPPPLVMTTSLEAEMNGGSASAMPQDQKPLASIRIDASSSTRPAPVLGVRAVHYSKAPPAAAAQTPATSSHASCWPAGRSAATEHYRHLRDMQSLLATVGAQDRKLRSCIDQMPRLQHRLSLAARRYQRLEGNLRQQRLREQLLEKQLHEEQEKLLSEHQEERQRCEKHEEERLVRERQERELRELQEKELQAERELLEQQVRELRQERAANREKAASCEPSPTMVLRSLDGSLHVSPGVGRQASLSESLVYSPPFSPRSSPSPSRECSPIYGSVPPTLIVRDTSFKLLQPTRISSARQSPGATPARLDEELVSDPTVIDR